VCADNLYFGADVSSIVTRLVGERLDDGGPGQGFDECRDPFSRKEAHAKVSEVGCRSGVHGDVGSGLYRANVLSTGTSGGITSIYNTRYLYHRRGQHGPVPVLVARQPTA
jgi:hypothetical protein